MEIFHKLKEKKLRFHLGYMYTEMKPADGQFDKDKEAMYMPHKHVVKWTYQLYVHVYAFQRVQIQDKYVNRASLTEQVLLIVKLQIIAWMPCRIETVLFFNDKMHQHNTTEERMWQMLGWIIAWATQRNSVRLTGNLSSPTCTSTNLIATSSAIVNISV